MKRRSYWYVYELKASEDCPRFESVAYCTKAQLEAFYLKGNEGLSYCRCSKAVASQLSREIGVPVYDYSNVEC